MRGAHPDQPDAEFTFICVASDRYDARTKARRLAPTFVDAEVNTGPEPVVGALVGSDVGWPCIV